MISMHKILPCFLLIVSLSTISCVAQKSRSKKSENAPKKSHLVKGENRKDELGRKQGTWKFFNSESYLVYEVNYLNDVKHGVSRRYHAGTGTQIEEANYFNGKLDGDYRSYFVAGQVKSEGSYTNGKRNGEWANYYAVNGEKKSEGAYVMGIKQGEWKYYHSKGYMKCKGNFVNDVQDGIWTFYGPDGKVTETKQYSKGNEVDSNTIKDTKPVENKSKKTASPKK